jgi:UDP-glucose 6-dehydrogenase
MLVFLTQNMDISIIGSGYVGLVTGACFADVGHNVICVDNDQRKVDALQSGLKKSSIETYRQVNSVSPTVSKTA